MAISAIEYALFRNMRQQDVLELGLDVLELGQANWYGDIPLDIFMRDISMFAASSSKDQLIEDVKTLQDKKPISFSFDIAEIWWKAFVQPKSLTAIDFNGTEKALKIDLNHPISLPQKYGLVTNFGTAEHVFNIGQVFKSIHEVTLPGGLMIHGLPFLGWIEHGFYNVNPTCYWDLADANNYSVFICVYAELNPAKMIQLETRDQIFELLNNGEINENSLIYTIFRKSAQETEFVFPIQGYYAKKVSQESRKAWKKFR